MLQGVSVPKLVSSSCGVAARVICAVATLFCLCSAAQTQAVDEKFQNFNDQELNVVTLVRIPSVKNIALVEWPPETFPTFLPFETIVLYCIQHAAKSKCSEKR